MNLKIAFVLIIYWSFFGLFFTLGDSVLGGNPLTNDGYSSSTGLNASGFDADNEFNTDTGGFWNFFNSVSAIFVAMGRFFGLMLLGITPVLSGTAQILFSTWQTGWALLTIGFIIDAVWSG